MTTLLIVAIILSLGLLAIQNAALSVWSVLVGFWLLFFSFIGAFSLTSGIICWSGFTIAFSLFLIKPLRQQLFSKYILKRYQKLMPTMSQTEKEALMAGTVSIDGDLFSGRLNWQTVFDMPNATLTSQERDFINGPVEKLCQMIDTWDITHQRVDMPPEMWTFLKREGFFSLIIKKQYGGKEFSAYAHSKIIQKIGSVSVTVGSTVAVPNSLGPAELLQRYGTDDQKNYYLPRLAKGEEIPCFALTGPTAGSDAANMPDTGVVCWGEYQGNKTLGIKLNWDKRYITLAPVATLLGLAFKLYDPDHLIGKETSLGITCALIPVTTPGVQIGRRHFPLNIPFQNGPTQGHDVFIPLDFIIGGKDMAGQGWRMLMECLAAGRGISLPGMALGGAKAGVAASSAYARIRKQFNLAIAEFEGIQEVLGRMSAHTLMIDAANFLTMSLLDNQEKPAVISGIMKYYATEMGRDIGNDAMDIHGGKGICLGPNNYLGRAYQAIPISITVEGANILTRNMIIFGQGAIRCHPYTLKEIEAANNPDQKAALALFDKAIFSHFGYLYANKIATFFHAVTGSRFVSAPKSPFKRYCQHISRLSHAYAFLTDVSMIFVGSALKRKESLSARFADILGYLYFATALIKYAHALDYPPEAKKVFKWALDDLLYNIQITFDEILENYPNRFLGKALALTIFPLGKHFKPPKIKDALGIAKLVTQTNPFRETLIEGAFLTEAPHNLIGKMQTLFHEVNALQLIDKHFNQAIKSGLIESIDYDDRLHEAVEKEILSVDEADALAKINHAIKEVIAVDDFAPDELVREATLVGDKAI